MIEIYRAKNYRHFERASAETALLAKVSRLETQVGELKTTIQRQAARYARLARQQRTVRQA